MKFNYWAALAGLLVLVLAAACDPSEDNARSDTARTARESSAPGPPCEHIYWGPYRNIKLMCTEVVYDKVAPPEAAPALYGMDLAPDGTLYFVRPAFGDIWAMRDADGDQYMDAPFRAVDGLRLPTRLSVQPDALLVASADGLLRLPRTGPDVYGDPVVLVDNVQADGSVWPGTVRVGPDNRLYLGLGASENQPGQIISVAADGTDRRLVATGLHDPADFTWHPTSGDLWVLDSRGPDAPYDALFRVSAEAAAAPDFGYPNCLYGTESACAGVTPPAFRFDDGSDPTGLLFYTFPEWEFWSGDLFVALGGSWNRVEPSGYGLVAVDFGEDFQPTGTLGIIVPASENDRFWGDLAEFSLAGIGFFPYHLSDVVIDDQGWLYVGIAEGRIFRFRPRPAP